MGGCTLRPDDDNDDIDDIDDIDDNDDNDDNDGNDGNDDGGGARLRASLDGRSGRALVDLPASSRLE